VTKAKSIIQRGSCSPEEAAALFDALEPVDTAFMLGSWRGAGLSTGHPMDGYLETFGWYGKRFDSTEKVHPLVFRAPGGALKTLEPQRVFAGMALMRFPSVAKSAAVGKGFGMAMGLLATRRPAARLRVTRYRDQTTATMIYDRLPINDSFVRVDEDTVLGVMDLRGMRAPFWFSLQRDG